MLYITTKDPSDVFPRDWTWLVEAGPPQPVGSLIPETLPIYQVVEVQANGTELRWIRQHVLLPLDLIGAEVVHWYGDDAKFIVGNLPHG